MEKKAKIILLQSNPNDETTNGIFLKNRNWYHLYIVNNDEIKEGDYGYYEMSNGWYDISKIDDRVNDSDIYLGYKKIIATTDTSLETHEFEEFGFGASMDKYINLPQIPKSFIDKYITEYNKGNVIEDVLVDYELLAKCGNVLLPCSPHNNKDNSDMSIYSEYLKISKDNTITISKVKNS